MKNKIILLIFLLSSLLASAQTQVSVSINLLPPYSTRLSDYANNPGKALVTLRNTQPRAVTVYLRATITGDNGILVFTNPNYRPARGITLEPNIPFTLTVGDLQDVFDVNQLNTRGISMSDIERKNGLPEGIYQVCVRAYDFSRQTVPLSPEAPMGCTTIRLTRLEPPMLVKPFEDEDVASFQPQNMIFSWTMPAGAPPGTQYKLKIVEIFDKKRNPNDAYLSSTQPPFFEKVVSGNVYVYGPADPQLVNGRKYAWAVTALDQIRLSAERTTSEGTAFRNGGRSEIRAFTYKQKEATKVDFKEPLTGKKKTPLTPKDFKYDPNIQIKNLFTSVSGRLLYAYPEDYKMDTYSGSTKVLSKSNFTTKQQNRPGDLLHPFYSTASHLNPTPSAKPMKKVKVNLVMVYAFKSEDQNLSGLIPLYDAGNGWKILTSLGQTDLVDYTVNNKNIESQPLTKVLATGYTNDNGEFNLGFLLKDTASIVSFNIKEPDKETYLPSYQSPTGEDTTIVEKGALVNGKIMRKTCILIVESPYYCSPFMMVDPRPKDNIMLPDMVGLVKSFEMHLTAKNNDAEGQMGGKSGGLENINVELFRRTPMDISLPENEGQNLPASSVQSLKMGEYSWIYPISKVARVVALGKTDAKGVAKIPRVIRIGSKKDDVFIAHTYSDTNVGNYNKKDGIKAIDSYSSNGIYSNGFDGDFDENLEFNSAYKYTNEVIDVLMNSKKPVVKGKVVEKNMGLKGVTVFLKAKQTTITEKKMDPLGFLTETNVTTGFNIIAAQSTTADGYFEFKDLSPGDYILEFQKSGYKTKTFNADNKPFSLLSGQLLQTNEITMQPSGTILACVTDEDGNKVLADVQVEDGALYKTSEASGLLGGCASFPAPGGKARKIKVFPRSSEFYEGEFIYDIKEDGLTTIPGGTLVVLRRKHRINVKVNGKQGNDVMPLEGATVTIKDKVTAKTDSKGIATITFESPGTSFIVKVKPAPGDNFSHWEEEVTIPITKKPVNKVVDLTPAKEILASVTEVKEGKTQPSKGAKVYVKTLKNGWGNSSANYAECFTDANGNCSLRGIPVAENNVEVYVSKNVGDELKEGVRDFKGTIDPGVKTGQVIQKPNGPDPLKGATSPNEDKSGNYIGEKKEAYWFNGQFQSKVALKLDFKKDFSVKDVWGFPVHIEVVEAQADGSFLLSGSLHDLPDNGSFASIDAQNRLDFKKIKFIKTAAGNNTHQPQSDKLELQQKTFPVKIGKGLQGTANVNTLSAPAIGLTFPKLYAQKASDGKGEIRAAVQLQLSSFEGAYQLSGKVELGENGNPGNIMIFKAGSAEKRKLNIGSSVSNTSMTNLKFKVHKFSAEADVAKSYIYGDSVRFYTILHTNIQDVSPADIALKAGYITALSDKIVPFEGGDDISFSLEKWKVVGQKGTGNMVWKYDNNNGGIMIEKAVVNTGIISVNLKNMIIKPDKLIADKLELDSKDASAFSLGGIVPLEILPGSQTLFSYDPNCYHDNKPHWKLSVLSKGGAEVAARVTKLDGLDDGQKLEFGSMNLFSDNQQQLNGPSAKQITLFKVLKLALNTIDVGNNFFTLVGQASMDIPNMNNAGGGIVGQIVYSKNASGQVKADIKPLFFDIEGKGQVSFHADDDAKSQSISSGLYTAKGTLKVYDSPSGKSFLLQTLLKHQKTKDGYSTSVEVLENQKVPLESKYLEIKPGLANSSMKVVGGAWDNLSLRTLLPTGDKGFSHMKDDEKDRTLVLVVKGAIVTDMNDDQSGIGVKGMETGIGRVTLFYNFVRQEVRGQFTFTPPVPIACGIVNITSGNVSMVIGTNGMYTMLNGTGEVALFSLPIPVDAASTVLAGYYTKPIYDEDRMIITDLSVQKSLPVELASGIQGVYNSVNVNFTPFDESFGFDGGIAVAKCWAKVGGAMEFRSFVNFRSFTQCDIKLGAYAIAGFDVGGEASILGIGVSGGVKFNAQVALTSEASPQVGLNFASIKNTLKSLGLSGCGSVGASFNLGACIKVDLGPLGEVDECAGFDVGKDFSVNLTTKPKVDLSFSFGNCGNGMPVQKLQ